jgi:hypothetical protein
LLPDEEKLRVFYNLDDGLLQQELILGSELHVRQKKQKKPGAAIGQSTRKPLSARYAEVLKLREAVAQTQSHLQAQSHLTSAQPDRVIRGK